MTEVSDEGAAARVGSATPAIGAIEELRTTECWRLVETSDLCRFAIETPDGGPDVFPMNYLVHDGGVFLRSAPGEKLRSLASRPAVALEVDGEEGGSHWSVVIRGIAEKAATDSEVAASGVLRLVSMSPTPKHDVIRVTPRTITGRRFRIDAAAGGALYEASTSGEPRRPSPPRGRAQDKPNPIPHTAPVVDDDSFQRLP